MVRMAGGCAALLFILLAALSARGGVPYKSAPGPHFVIEEYETWRDGSRQRDIPVKIYAPDRVDKPGPVIFFSHGLGGTRDNYAYLGRHWASQGYVCVFVQHIGSDYNVFDAAGDKALKAALRAALDSQNWINRPMDIRFAMDRVEEACRSQPLFRDRADPTRMGVAGHSYGAYTALALMGLDVRFPDGKDRNFQDPRVRAAIEMSGPGAMGGAIRDDAYRGIATPCLHLVGSLDASPMFRITVADRRVPFQKISGADQYLVMIENADHYAFADNERGLDNERMVRVPEHYGYILAATTAFWDAYLRDEPDARAWLAADELVRLSRGACTLERRLAGGVGPAATRAVR